MKNYINTQTALTLMVTAFVLLFLSSTLYASGRLTCGDKIVRVGQTKDQVKTSLDEPLRIEKSEFKDQNGTTVHTAKWIYACGNKTYVLLFQNETVISIYQITESDTQ